MGKYQLIPHPDHPPRAISAIEVMVRRPAIDRLEFDYWLLGEIDDLRLPAPVASLRTEGLWHTTCCEAFLKVADATAYQEFNFSPSTAWAAYGFPGYRDPERVDAWLPEPPEVSLVLHRADRLLVGARLTLPLGQSERKLALSVIIEETDGTKSYWALAHPPGKPDFHHPDCFAAELPAPEGA